jgi:hypothetical protein
MRKFTVTFIDWQNKERFEVVNCHECTDCFGKAAWYADSLAKMGCGKNASDPWEAIQRLVFDHGHTLLTMTEI